VVVPARTVRRLLARALPTLVEGGPRGCPTARSDRIRIVCFPLLLLVVLLWLIHRFLAFLCVLLVVLVLNVVIVFNVVLVLVFDVVASAIAIDFAIGLTIRLAIGDGSRLGGRRGIGLAI
jgi:hypothetical protein